MPQLAILPNYASVEAAWERYRSLAAASLNDDRLKVDRRHQEAVQRAYREWSSAFQQWDARQ